LGLEIQVSDSLFAMKIGGVRTILISAEDQQLANAKASPRDRDRDIQAVEL